MLRALLRAFEALFESAVLREAPLAAMVVDVVSPKHHRVPRYDDRVHLAPGAVKSSRSFVCSD